jgi:hypothetical protein
MSNSKNDLDLEKCKSLSAAMSKLDDIIIDIDSTFHYLTSVSLEISRLLGEELSAASSASLREALDIAEKQERERERRKREAQERGETK